jgi:2'-5' RNA ligase
MRLFLAVHPGQQLVDELATRVDRTRQQLDSCRSLRWTRPESWHLTLQFLGEWPQGPAEALIAALGQVPPAGPLTLNPTGLGAFPGLRRPRVLFLHLASDGMAEKLAASVRQVVGRTWPEGPQDTREFRAHLTLARVKGSLNTREHEVLDGLNLEGLPASQAREFRLMSSELNRQGARHHEVASFSLIQA